MQVFYADHFHLELPDGHRFPMAKYSRLRRRVEEELSGIELVEAPRALDRQLEKVHDHTYVRAVNQGDLDAAARRAIGFPWSPSLVERSKRSVGATIGACRAALHTGRGVNLAGGTHHASSNRGSGYCVFNDVAVAARAMQTESRVKEVLVVDCDVHQGDGTAEIFSDDPTVFTISLHGANNFPFRKQISDLDVGLPDGCEDVQYLDALKNALDQGFSACRPELVIYIAGADPFVEDQLGRLALSAAGLRARDRMIFERCDQAGIPVATAMGGGYAKDIDTIVSLHLETVRVAQQGSLSGPHGMG